jgi:hypothetical protein
MTPNAANTPSKSRRRSPCFAAAVATLHEGALTSRIYRFIQRAEKMAQLNRAPRADVRVTRADGSHDTAVILADPGRGRVFVAVESDGFRALSPLAWKPGTAVAKTGAAAGAHGADDPLGALGLRAADLFPAWAHDYTTAFISDETTQEKTVTIYGKKEIPYILFVVTFDKERLVPTLIKYYRERLNNLVRLRKDESYVMVGARPRPQKITVTDYTDNVTTTPTTSFGRRRLPPRRFSTPGRRSPPPRCRRADGATTN